MQFRNHYVCPNCKRHWYDIWSATCDDDCPHCGMRHISPTNSEDVDDEDAQDLAAHEQRSEESQP